MSALCAACVERWGVVTDVKKLGWEATVCCVADQKGIDKRMLFCYYLDVRLIAFSIFHGRPHME